MLVRICSSSRVIRRNYGAAALYRMGPPLLVRRSTPNRAWRRDASVCIGRRRSGPVEKIAQCSTLLMRLRKKLRTWKERIRSRIAELAAVGGSRPSRAFG